ncbi:methyl-accepting chemotaxis protein [Halapricum hydrolyticum]|uniref:Methyl-accepting chemotaxis protein n=1 Tax=Halapricum hydrolyticum TaxID=2979991 RepID=A0AAE3LGS8_9EURY|nr:methyl-accepting chemotaxis protein [Halapricum hydrolyticum]MCU4717057.1 methyl-accepting chemotaxis protein [Halapricum hydrolyticum]MCU4725984.1 methyl-accepting chemotaxis protein [Halapricum hydrolyticum]
MPSDSPEDETEPRDRDTGPVQSVVPRFVRRSFTLKFAIVLVVLGLTVGAVGVVGSEQLKSEFQDEVDEKLATLATQHATELADWNRTNFGTVRIYARSPAVRDGSVPTISNYLQQEQQKRLPQGGDSPPFLHYVNTTTGEITASSDSRFVNDTSLEAIDSGLSAGVERVRPSLGDFSIQTVRTEAFNSTFLREEGTVRVGYVSTVPGDPDHVLVYTVPVKTFTGNLRGQTAVDGASNGSATTGVTMVTSKLDGDERVLFEQYGNDDMLYRQYDEGNGIPATARSQGPANPGSSVAGPASGILSRHESTYELANREYAVGYAQVPGTGWVVMIHSNTKAAYGEVQSVADQALIATGVGILLIGLFGAALGRNTARSIDRLTGKAEKMEEGDLEVDFSSSRIDNIGRLYDGFANMRDALQQQIQEAEQARKEAEVSRAEAMEMSNHLQETADEYAEIMQQCAAGDLTRRMEADGENEAMDRIAEEFNEMIDELEKTTGQLKSFADEVETAGEVVQTSSESVRDASEQVADSIQKISDDAYDQKERLQEISGTMDQIATDLETFAAENDVDFGESLDRIEEIATMLNQVVDLSEETMAEAENVAGAAEEQAAELNEVTQRAEDLSRYARPLREVLDRFETESEHEFYFPTGPE